MRTSNINKQIVNLPGILKERQARRKGGGAQRLGTSNATATTLKLGTPVHMHFDVEDFDKLGIDRRYQREDVKPHVGRIIASLRAGGSIPDPITVAKRTFKERDERFPSPLYWIVDGQQRMWAALETNTRLEAICYEVASLDEERMLFILLNTRAAVHANLYVNAHSGPAANLLRAAASVPFAEGRIHYLAGGDKRRFGVATLASSMCRAYGVKHNGVARCLAALDPKIETDKTTAMRFLELICTIFPNNPGYEPLHALGIVCHERWAAKAPTLPDKRTLAAIRRIRFGQVIAGNAQERILLMVSRLRRAWA